MSLYRGKVTHDRLVAAGAIGMLNYVPESHDIDMHIEEECASTLCFGIGAIPVSASGEHMFDHLKFGVSNYSESRAFFLRALEPLGVVEVVDWPPNGVEICSMSGTSLCLYQTDEKPAHLHIAFRATSRHEVDAFYGAALEAGGKDNGPPGLRPQYSGRYYAAFVIGPDGHNIEAVCHEPEA
jgi:catechol 2,3-dioxygenase-like lactoylglutathione lyase family enzyme